MFNPVKYFFDVVFPAPIEVDSVRESRLIRSLVARIASENYSESPLLCLGRYVTQSDRDKQRKEASSYSF